MIVGMKLQLKSINVIELEVGNAPSKRPNVRGVCFSHPQLRDANLIALHFNLSTQEQTKIWKLSNGMGTEMFAMNYHLTLEFIR